MSVQAGSLGWLGIVRLGLVQAGLGAIVVLTTSTLNRVMVVELALPALLPGLLVAWHYVVQMARPRLGHGSDRSARRTPWIVGGMLALSAGGLMAAWSVVWMGQGRTTAGMALAVLAFTLIGLGVGASGTSLLVLLAQRVEEPRRAAAATIVWLMMIVGFIVTAGVSGKLLDPYSPERLLMVSAGVAGCALLLALAAVAGVEGPAVAPEADAAAKPPFRQALAEVWAEPAARHFTVFVFVSMLAYSAQDLILEPFAGLVYGYTPGQSTQLSGLQHGGVLCGMLLSALAGSRVAGRRWGSLKAWTVAGCLLSGLALAGLVTAGLLGPVWPLKPTVFALGVANGAFSIAAIGSMMRLAGEGRAAREGVRMGLWGAAQAVAFGFGGMAGAVASDIARHVIASPGPAYALVFGLEGLLFVLAAALALRVREAGPSAAAEPARPTDRQPALAHLKTGNAT